MQDNKNTPCTQGKLIRHGELMLVPVSQENAPDFSKAVLKKDYIASHSETGHHHVIMGDSMVLERPDHDTFVQIDKDTELVHTKEHDKHDTLPLLKGIFRLLRKKEYDPFEKVRREVAD